MARRKSLLASLLLFAFALLLSACAENPVTGRQELALVPVSEEEEVALGAKAFGPAVQQQGGFYRDRELEDYVQTVGMKVAKASHRPTLAYKFRILNSSVPNAFALPGGFIVINRGLLGVLTSEAEVAAVLAHEVAHVTARHSVGMYQRSVASNLLLAGIQLAAGDKRGVMEASAFSASLVEKGFSREQERESDSLGIDYMVGAGYNPKGMISLQEYFWTKLEGGKDPMWAEGLFRTHPFSKERLGDTKQRIAEKYSREAVDMGRVVNAKLFLQKVASMKDAQKAYDMADAGDKLLGEKKYDEALGKYRAAIARQPNQAPFHFGVGRALFAKKEMGGAETALSRSIELDDETFGSHLYLGAVKADERDHRGAIVSLDRSMDLLPTKSAAGLLSKSYAALGDREKAQKYAEMAK